MRAGQLFKNRIFNSLPAVAQGRSLQCTGTKQKAQEDKEGSKAIVISLFPQEPDGQDVLPMLLHHNVHQVITVAHHFELGGKQLTPTHLAGKRAMKCSQDLLSGEKTHSMNRYHFYLGVSTTFYFQGLLAEMMVTTTYSCGSHLNLCVQLGPAWNLSRGISLQGNLSIPEMYSGQVRKAVEGN